MEVRFFLIGSIVILSAVSRTVVSVGMGQNIDFEFSAENESRSLILYVGKVSLYKNVYFSR